MYIAKLSKITLVLHIWGHSLKRTCPNIQMSIIFQTDTIDIINVRAMILKVSTNIYLRLLFVVRICPNICRVSESGDPGKKFGISLISWKVREKSGRFLRFLAIFLETAHWNFLILYMMVEGNREYHLSMMSHIGKGLMVYS